MRGVEIEQIISDITNIINSLYLQGFIKDNEGQVSEKLKDFLALYQRTRVENQKLSKELTIKICNEVEAKVFEEMRTELKQEKEKNKELREELDRQINTRIINEEFVEKNFISKDEIREKIKELEEKSEYWNCDEIQVLKELLEENK